MTKTNNLFMLLACMLWCFSTQAQSPWTQEKGSGYGQLSFMSIPTYTSNFAKDGGNRDLERELTEIAIQLYGEYGIIEGTTAILDLPFKILNAGETDVLLPFTEEGTLAGLGNARLGVRQRLYDDKFNIAAQLMVELPIGRGDDATGLRTGYEALTLLPTLSLGSGFGNGYAFAYGGVGFRTNNDYSHYANVGIEGGYKFFDRLWFMLFFDVIRSLENGERDELLTYELTGFYVNDQEWASAGAKVLFEITENIGVTGATTLAAFAANEVPQSPSLSLGVYTKW